MISYAWVFLIMLGCIWWMWIALVLTGWGSWGWVHKAYMDWCYTDRLIKQYDAYFEAESDSKPESKSEPET